MRRRILLPWLGGIAVLMVTLLYGVRIQTDLSQFLPDATSTQDQVLLHQMRAGVAARMLLVAIGGNLPSTEIARASNSLARSLAPSPTFAWVANGGGNASTEADESSLFAYRYLIGPPESCVDALSERNLRQALEARLDELKGPVPPLDKARIPVDPTACYRAMLMAMVPETSPQRVNGVWFSPEAEQALLILRTRADASDLSGQRAAVAEIRQTFAALPQAGDLNLVVSGPAFFSVASEETIRRQTAWLTTGASLVVASILLLAFRSPVLVLVGILPLVTGVLAGAVAVGLTFGYLHGITFALGITLLGVAMDYPVHVISHAAQDHGGYSADRDIWRTLFLGVATTVLGYAALSLTSFQGLAQLGVLSAVGLVTAALSSRTLLPLLIPAGYRLPDRAWVLHWSDRLPPLPSSARLILVFSACSLLVAVLASRSNPWDSDLSRLSTVPKSDLAMDRKLRTELGAPDVARFFFVVGEDAETVLRELESVLDALHELVRSGVIRGFDAAPLWIPSAHTQRERQRKLPDRALLEKALAGASEKLPFREGIFTAFLDAAERSRTMSPLLASEITDTAVSARIGSLLQPFGEEWLGLVPLIGVGDASSDPPLRNFAAAHGLSYLDLREASANLLESFLGETHKKLVLATAVIAVVLAIGIRNMRRFRMVLLPILLALALDFSLLVILQGWVNLFHLVSLLLVLGLAIDYSLFFSRASGSADSRTRTGFALSVCAVSSFAMFGMLSLSSIPVLHAVGSTVAIGIALAFPLAFMLARNP